MLRQEREKVMNQIIDEYPSSNEIQLEDEADNRMKEQYVDTFTQLFQNNICFCLELLKSDLYQRVYERKERIEEEIENDPDLNFEHECKLILDAVTLSREYIEDLF